MLGGGRAGLVGGMMDNPITKADKSCIAAMTAKKMMGGR